jgi:predicted enzyme related to lactoylglutathione lyase
MIPADNGDRVTHFYSALIGWMIEPTQTPVDAALTAGVFLSILN